MGNYHLRSVRVASAAPLTAALFVCTLCGVVEGKPRQVSISSLEEFWTFLIVVNALLFLPVIAYFLYSVARDPATPQLGALMWTWLKGKCLGVLSTSESAVGQPNKRDADRAPERVLPPSALHAKKRI